VTIEQRIAQQLDASLTDAEFDTLSAEADADAEAESESYGVAITTAEPGPTFRDCRTMPSPQPAIPLDHDGRGPRVDTRRDDYQSLFGLKTGRHSHPATHPLWMVFTDSNCVVCA
jgi:hypothetical protein